MPSFQYRELLAKSEVFKKQTATTVEESGDCTRQEYKHVYHVRVLSRSTCEWQCRILLKPQADRIVARDRAEYKALRFGIGLHSCYVRPADVRDHLSILLGGFGPKVTVAHLCNTREHESAQENYVPCCHVP
jgi:hypothetical protein